MTVIYFMDFVVQLHIFVQLQQDVQAKYPEFLVAVVSKLVPIMTHLDAEDGCRERLFTNFIHLCRWSSVPDTHHSAWYRNYMFLYIIAALFICCFQFLCS